MLRGNADVRRLIGACAFSLSGDWFAFVALSGFVYHHTGSAGWTALLFAINSLPGGLRVACDLGSVVPVIGLLIAFHAGSVALALGCLAALSVLAAVAGPIPEAALPNLVTSRELPLAQTVMGSLYSAGLLVGAGLGGVVTAAWGTSATVNPLKPWRRSYATAALSRARLFSII